MARSDKRDASASFQLGQVASSKHEESLASMILRNSNAVTENHTDTSNCPANWSNVNDVGL